MKCLVSDYKQYSFLGDIIKKILFLISILCTTPLMATKPEFNIQGNDYHLTFSDVSFTLVNGVDVIDITRISLPEYENILIINAKNKPQPSLRINPSILLRVEDGKMVVYLPYTWGPNNMTSDYKFTIPEGIFVEIKESSILLHRYKDSNDLLL
ncbi:MAG: hypothetical protein Q8L85_05525 [Alphaproteobacteria bacterium]|nr:hypothetical protein [Alphaproteobacteria bacterium]